MQGAEALLAEDVLTSLSPSKAAVTAPSWTAKARSNSRPKAKEDICTPREVSGEPRNVNPIQS